MVKRLVAVMILLGVWRCAVPGSLAQGEEYCVAKTAAGGACRSLGPCGEGGALASGGEVEGVARSLRRAAPGTQPRASLGGDRGVHGLAGRCVMV